MHDDLTESKSVTARLGYLGPEEGRVFYSIFPPASGITSTAPSKAYFELSIRECRRAAIQPHLDKEGFLLCRSQLPRGEFLDPRWVTDNYYPTVEALVKEATGAHSVFAFDHNIRSAAGAALGHVGVRPPVDAVHCDYTESSGNRRIHEVLEANGQLGLRGHRAALINVWRPLRGPVQDFPLALCDALSVDQHDLVDTDIDHFDERDLAHPSHQGQIYSVRHSARHRWFYFSEMQADEVLLFKCFDSDHSGVARVTPHTGFANPECPLDFLPRESIETRTLVIYPLP